MEADTQINTGKKFRWSDPVSEPLPDIVPVTFEEMADPNRAPTSYAGLRSGAVGAYTLEPDALQAFQSYDPKDPEDYNRDIVNRVIRSVTQVDDPMGKLFNDGKPLPSADDYYRRVQEALQGNPQDSAKLAAWKAIPAENAEERFKTAQGDKSWWIRAGESLFDKDPDLTDEEAFAAGEDVAQAHAIVSAWEQAQKQRDVELGAARGTIVRAKHFNMNDDERRELIQARKAAESAYNAVQEPPELEISRQILAPHREQKGEQAVISAYEIQLHAQNAYAMVSTIFPKLSPNGQAFARHVVENQGKIKGAFDRQLFSALPEEEQELIVSLSNSAQPPAKNAAVSAVTQMGKRFGSLLVESSKRYGDMIFDWDPVDPQKAAYEKRVDARLRAANALNTDEFGFWGNALVAAGDSAGYMAFNGILGGIKYVGAPVSFAALMPDYQNQIEEKIAMSGGDVTGNTAKMASFGGAFAQVLIERLQMAGWWSRITNQNAKQFAMRTAFQEFAKKGERIAWDAARNFSKELGEEVLQRGAEEVAENIGMGADAKTTLRESVHGMWNEASESFGAILLMSGGSSSIQAAQNIGGRLQLSTADLLGIEKVSLRLRENLAKGEFNGIKATYGDIAYLARSIVDSPDPIAKARELGLGEAEASWLAGTLSQAVVGVNSASSLTQEQKNDILQYRPYSTVEFLKNNYPSSTVVENEDGTIDVSMDVVNRNGEREPVTFRVVQDERRGALSPEQIDTIDMSLAQSVVSYLKEQGTDTGGITPEELVSMPQDERRAFFAAHPMRVNGNFSMTAPTGATVTDEQINTLNGWITVDPEDISTSFHEAMHGLMRWMVDTKQFTGEEIDALVTQYGRGTDTMPWNDETFARDYHAYMNSKSAHGEFIRTNSQLVFEKVGAFISQLASHLAFWHKRQSMADEASSNILEAARRGNFSGVKIQFQQPTAMSSEIADTATAQGQGADPATDPGQSEDTATNIWEEDGVKGEFAIVDAQDIPAIGEGSVLAGVDANVSSVAIPTLSASGELIVGNSHALSPVTPETAAAHGFTLDPRMQTPVLVRIAAPETSVSDLQALNEIAKDDARYSVTGAEDEQWNDSLDKYEAGTLQKRADIPVISRIPTVLQRILEDEGVTENDFRKEQPGRIVEPEENVNPSDSRNSVKSYGQNYGDDAKLVAVAASQIAAGRDVDAEALQRVAKWLPRLTITPEEAVKSATEILADEKNQVGKDIIAALANGDGLAAQDVAANAYTRQNVHKIVADAVASGAAIGEKWGKSGEAALNRSARTMFAQTPGEDVRKFDLWYGVDTASILLKHTPEEFSGKKQKPELTPEAKVALDSDDTEENDEQMSEEERQEAALDAAGAFGPEAVSALGAEQRKRIDAVVKETKAEMARREASKAEQAMGEAKAAQDRAEAQGEELNRQDPGQGDPTEGETPDERDEQLMDLLADVSAKYEVDLSNAAEYAYALHVMFRDYVMEKQGIKNKKEVFDKAHQENVAAFRRTMQEKLRQMVREYLNPESTGLGMLLRRMIDDIPVLSSPHGIERSVARVLRTLQANAIRQSRKELVSTLKANLKQAAIEGRVVEKLNSDFNRKINLETEMMVRYIVKIVEWSPEYVSGEADRLQKIIDGRQEAYQAEQTPDAKEEPWLDDAVVHDAAVKLQLLNKYGALNRLMPAEIIAKGAELREYVRTELRKHYEQWWKTMADCAWVKSAFLRGVTYAKDKMRPDKETGLQKFVRSGVSTIRQQLEYMIADCPYDSQEYADAKKAIDWLCEKIAEGSTDYANLMNDYRQENRELLTTVAGKGNETAFLSHLQEFIPEEVSRRLHNREAGNRMTFDNAIQLYASLRQTQSYQDNIEKHGRESDLGVLEGILSETDLKYWHGLLGLYQRRRMGLDAAVKQFTGMGVYSPDPLYAPVRMWTGSPNDLPVTVSAYSAFAKSLTPRQFNGRDFNTQAGASQLLVSRSEDSARAIAYGNVGVALRAILAGKEMQDAMARYSGDASKSQLMRQVRDTLMHGAPDALTLDIDGTARFFRKVSTYATLGFNLSPSAKQMTSIWTFALVHPDGLKAVWQGLAEGDHESRKVARRELMDSAGWRARYRNYGFSFELEAVFSEPKTTWLEKFYQMGMKPIQIGDMVPSLLVGPGLYLAARNDYVNQGMDYEAAKTKAAAEVMAMVEASQQSSHLENIPDIVRRGGDVGKLLFQFSSAPFLQMGYEFNAMREWRRRVDPEGQMSLLQAVAKSRENSTKGIDDGRGRIVNAVVVNHVLMPLSLWFASTLVKGALGQVPDKDKWYKEVLIECLMGAFGRILIYGSLAQAGLRTAAGLPVFATELAADSVITRMFPSGFAVAQDLVNFDFDIMIGDLDDFLSTVLPVYRDGSKAIKNYGIEGGEKAVKRKRAARKRK